MTTSQVFTEPTGTATVSGQRYGPVWRVTAGLISGATAIAAYVGTWYLTGEEAAMWDVPSFAPAFLPGGAWAFAGFALLLFVAAPMSVAALMAFSGHRGAAEAAMVAGALLVGWIIVQVMLIGLVALLQPIMFLVGVVVFAMGLGAYQSKR